MAASPEIWVHKHSPCGVALHFKDSQYLLNRPVRGVLSAMIESERADVEIDDKVEIKKLPEEVAGKMLECNLDDFISLVEMLSFTTYAEFKDQYLIPGCVFVANPDTAERRIVYGDVVKSLDSDSDEWKNTRITLQNAFAMMHRKFFITRTPKLPEYIYFSFKSGFLHKLFVAANKMPEELKGSLFAQPVQLENDADAGNVYYPVNMNFVLGSLNSIMSEAEKTFAINGSVFL